MSLANVVKLLDEGRLIDAFKLSRYYYRFGLDGLPDNLYDSLENIIKKEFPEEQMLKQTYDDDEIPRGLLIEFNESWDSDSDDEFYDDMNEEKSFSIRSVSSMEEAWEWFRGYLNQDIILMLKDDGIYTKTKYDEEGIHRTTLSRGRSGNSLNFSNIVKRYVLPVKIDIDEPILVYGEAFVDELGLKYLREKYPEAGKYKTTKGGAVSLLRVEHHPADYDKLTLMTFDAEGLADTKSETLDKLDELGFVTVPRLLFEAGYFTGTFEDFQKKMKKAMVHMWDKTQTGEYVIPTDGLVAELDNKLRDTAGTNQYQARNIALKLGEWEDVLYKGIIKAIIPVNTRVNSGIRLEIEPVLTDDGNTSRLINAYNLRVVQENKLFPGNTVYFKRKGKAYNNVVYGEELKKLLEGEI